MFMEIAIGAIGIGIVLMIGYLVIAQVKAALPTASNVQIANPCVGLVGTDQTSGAVCTNVSVTYYATSVCGTTNLTSSNASSLISCPNVGYTTGTNATQATVFAGFGLLAVGIIVLAAFGLIQIFK
jgi:hypothetical protein